MRKLATPAYDLERLCRHGDRAAAEPGVELSFSVSVNPRCVPKEILSACLDVFVVPGLGKYPDADSRSLAKRLAWQHGVASEQVVIGNGANELIYATARALKPRQVAIAEPTYTEYLRASLLMGATVTHWFPEDEDFTPGPFDPKEAEIIWLCNPNNPTGRLWPAGALVPWIESKPQTVFVVDEAFLPFREDEMVHSLIRALDRLDNLVVVRSLTKVYALAGLRLGYAVASAALAARLREQIVPWSVNSLAQAAGVAALDDEPFLAVTRNWLARTLPSFLTRLAGCSSCLRPIPSQANFVLIRLKDTSAGWLARRLAERGIAIRDASNFIGLGPEYVRLSLRQAEDNERLLRELQLVFQEG
jgi:threonine-phosphate decarboxylase